MKTISVVFDTRERIIVAKYRVIDNQSVLQPLKRVVALVQGHVM
jgi:hypothetical protein